jgi:hypothetical protein
MFSSYLEFWTMDKVQKASVYHCENIINCNYLEINGSGACSKLWRIDTRSNSDATGWDTCLFVKTIILGRRNQGRYDLLLCSGWEKQRIQFRILLGKSAWAWPPQRQGWHRTVTLRLVLGVQIWRWDSGEAGSGSCSSNRSDISDVEHSLSCTIILVSQQSHSG